MEQGSELNVSFNTEVRGRAAPSDPGEDVTPVCEPLFVGTEETQRLLAQLRERVEKVERWNADLEDELAGLRELLGAIGMTIAQSIRPTNSE